MKGFKFLAVFTFLISAASLAASGFLYQQVRTEQAAYEKLEERYAQLEERNAELRGMETKFGQIQQEVDRLRGQIKGYVEQREEARREVDEAYRQIAELRKQIKTVEAARGELTSQAAMEDVEEKAIVQEAAKLSGAPAPLEIPKEAKGKKKGEKEKPAAPLPTVAAEDSRPTQVLTVNRQFNFVVVNVGLRDRVKIGDTLRIEQGGQLVGRVAIEKLYENFSACTIVEEIKPHQIKEGDLVRPA